MLYRVLNTVRALPISFAESAYGLISSISIADKGVIEMDTPVANKPHSKYFFSTGLESTLVNATGRYAHGIY